MKKLLFTFLLFSIYKFRINTNCHKYEQFHIITFVIYAINGVIFLNIPGY